MTAGCKETRELINQLASAEPGTKVPYLWGPSGFGKTFTLRGLGNVLVLNISQVNPADFLCQSVPGGNGGMKFLKPAWLTEFEEGDYEILFLDEIDKVALPTLRSALLTILRDRQIGPFQIPGRIVAAGNTLISEPVFKTRLIQLKFKRCTCAGCIKDGLLRSMAQEFGQISTADLAEIRRVLSLDNSPKLELTELVANVTLEPADAKALMDWLRQRKPRIRSQQDMLDLILAGLDVDLIMEGTPPLQVFLVNPANPGPLRAYLGLDDTEKSVNFDRVIDRMEHVVLQRYKRADGTYRRGTWYYLLRNLAHHCYPGVCDSSKVDSPRCNGKGAACAVCWEGWSFFKRTSLKGLSIAPVTLGIFSGAFAAGLVSADGALFGQLVIFGHESGFDRVLNYGFTQGDKLKRAHAWACRVLHELWGEEALHGDVGEEKPWPAAN